MRSVLPPWSTSAISDLQSAGSRGHVAHGGAGHIGDVLDLELRKAVAAVAAALGVVCGAARSSRNRMLGRGFVAKVAQHVFAQAAVVLQ